MGEPNPHSPDFDSNGVPTVGIGASAGGLEALTSLLEALPTDTGLAFVCIQHLDPNHESLLSNLLAKATRMPVHQVKGVTLVEPNHVYVIPANASLAMSRDALLVGPREANPGLRLPIDGFLYSLAENRRQAAIAVVLSGTGSDGALGLKLVKSEGGITFAQDQKSAKFGAMPKNAVATGCVDYVLEPQAIARELARIGRHPYLLHPGATEVEGLLDEETEHFRELFKIIYQATKVDFSVYRQTTVQRRVRRRQALHDIETLAAYVKFVHDSPVEIHALYQDLLIRVTQFFRDPECFDALASQVFPQMLRNGLAGDPLRLWVPGCATGEEAYSLAICLLEYLEKIKRDIPIQLFASDVNQASITRARKGFYLESICADISPKRLQRFFTHDGEGYRIKSEVRDLCVFARHDLIRDPPYSKLDLISCRNVLIYMGSMVSGIMPLFHYGLKPDGFLLLGSSESAGGFSSLFMVNDNKHKIYSRKEAPPRFPLYQFQKQREIPALHGKLVLGSRATLDSKKRGMAAPQPAPASVVIDQNMDLISVVGDLEPYLEVSGERERLNLLKMARSEDLSKELRAAVAKVKREGVPLRKERVTIDQRGVSVNVEVIPVGPKDRGTYLVVFDPSPPPGSGSGRQKPPREIARAKRKAGERDLEILRLEEALAQTTRRLLSVIESQATSGAVAQSEQEEAQSNIEELQSLNEELETAKEELQSANEELQSTNEELKTINEELQTLNVEVSHSRNFSRSIVETIQHPLLVLDTELRVKTANQAFYRFFRTAEADTEGRLVYDLERCQWDTSEFRRLLNEVLPNHKIFSDFELKLDLSQIGSKVVQVGARQIDSMQMILLSVIDITDQKHSERALRRSEEHLRHAQKMEAMGRLAGGVAHEFNNQLMGILGFSELLLERLETDDPRRGDLQEIKKCADRATSLTTQLLTFSRRQVLQPRMLGLNSIVSDLDRMLRRLIGENIELILASDEPLGTILADPGQIAQIVMNLVLNSRDAMLQSGTLTIETRNADFDAISAAQQDLSPGRYVILAVTDTGMGIDPETQAHLFEPFFTTKPKGLGTGLGLATVYGIVEQSGAKIRFSSTVGQGTTFKIFFPRVADPTARVQGLLTEQAVEPRGTEVVLLAEDEDSVRRLTRTFLESRGYSVLEAKEGFQGLELCKNQKGPVHLLLTDVVMPEMGGIELARQAVLVHPKMKVLFMSGYPDDPMARENAKVQGAPSLQKPLFLQKPFTLQELGRRVREILDSAEG